MSTDAESGAAKLAAIDEAIARFRGRGEDPGPVLAAREMIVGQMALAGGDAAGAAAAFGRSIEQFREANMEPQRAAVATTAALGLERLGGEDEALVFAEAALESAERVWGRSSPAERLGVPAALVTAADVAVRLAAKRRDAGKVFEYAQRAKARWVLDALSLREVETLGLPFGRAALDGGPAAAALGAAIAQLDAAWNAYFERGRADGIADAEARLIAAYSTVASAGAPLRLLHVATTTIAECQAALVEGEALVEWFVETHGLAAVVVRRDGAQLLTWQWPAQALREALTTAYLRIVQSESRREFREEAAAVEDAERRALLEGLSGILHGDTAEVTRRLGDALLGPLLPELDGVRRLIVCAHWVLHVLPFAALAENAEAGAVRAGHLPLAVTYAPSASCWLRLRRLRGSAAKSNPATAPAEVLGVERRLAPPAQLLVDAAGPPSPAPPPPSTIEDEARAVAAALHVSPRIGAAATKQALWNALAEPRLVHVSAHGELSRPNPLVDGVHLADGLLSLAEILATPAFPARLQSPASLSPGPSLVVLSVCRSGFDRVEPGDRLLGAGHGLLARLGCRVLASLWEVDVEATALLMERFFAHRAAPLDDAEALRRAQLDVRASSGAPMPSGQPFSFADPWFWAGFVLLGD